MEDISKQVNEALNELNDQSQEEFDASLHDTAEDETPSDAEIEQQRKRVEQLLDSFAAKRNDIEGLDEIVTDVLTESNEASGGFILNEISRRIEDRIASFKSRLEGLAQDSDDYKNLSSRIDAYQGVIDEIHGSSGADFTSDSLPDALVDNPELAPIETPEDIEEETEEAEEEDDEKKAEADEEKDKDDEEEDDEEENGLLGSGHGKKKTKSNGLADTTGVATGAGLSVGLGATAISTLNDVIGPRPVDGATPGAVAADVENITVAKENVESGEIASSEAAHLEIGENVNNALDDTDGLVRIVEHDGAMKGLATDLFYVIDMLNTPPTSPDFEKNIREYSKRGIDITKALRGMVNEAGLTQANEFLDGIETAINNISVVLEQHDEDEHPNGIVKQLVEEPNQAEANTDI